MTIETFRVCFGKRSGKTAIMIHNPLDKIIKTRKQWVFKALWGRIGFSSRETFDY